MTVDGGRPCDLLEDGRVHRDYFDPSGYPFRWVAPDQCQASVDIVEQVGTNEGEVTVSENIKLDYFSKLSRDESRER